MYAMYNVMHRNARNVMFYGMVMVMVLVMVPVMYMYMFMFDVDVCS